MLNIQPPESRAELDASNTLDVFDIFYTIQGEGPFSGRPAIFIRLAGCNLQCPLCDTDYTSKRTKLTTDEVIVAVMDMFSDRNVCTDASTSDYSYPLVVITGGEPMRQHISGLCNELIGMNVHVQIETNGMYFIDDLPYFSDLFTLVCSPKTYKVHKDLAGRVDFWKYVADFMSLSTSPDGLPIYALEHPIPKDKVLYRHEDAMPHEIYLSPVDNKDDKHNELNRVAVRTSCLQYGYTVSLQIHKYLGVE